MKKRYESGLPPKAAAGLRQSVAGQMKAARKSEGLTQEVLADRVGTKKSNISRMESGRYNPSLDFMARVASCLDRKISVRLMAGSFEEGACEEGTKGRGGLC